MKIYNNTNITYSAIEQNSREHTKQNDTVYRHTFHFKNGAGEL